MKCCVKLLFLSSHQQLDTLSCCYSSTLRNLRYILHIYVYNCIKFCMHAASFNPIPVPVLFSTLYRYGTVVVIATRNHDIEFNDSAIQKSHFFIEKHLLKLSGSRIIPI